jgi:hypothetical protein
VFRRLEPQRVKTLSTCTGNLRMERMFMLLTSNAPMRRGTHTRAIATLLAALMMLIVATAIEPARAAGHHGGDEHRWRGRPWHGGYYGHRHYWQGYPPYFYASPPVIYYPPPVVYPPPPPVFYLPPPPTLNFVFSWQHR